LLQPRGGWRGSDGATRNDGFDHGQFLPRSRAASPATTKRESGSGGVSSRHRHSAPGLTSCLPSAKAPISRMENQTQYTSGRRSPILRLGLAETVPFYSTHVDGARFSSRSATVQPAEPFLEGSRHRCRPIQP
jgi:hypothetical protein